MAAIEAVLGQLDLVTADYIEAAGHFRAAADLEKTDEAKRRSYTSGAARALFAQGAENHDLEALKQAAALDRQLLLETPRGLQPDDWAALQDDLGNALLRVGAREMNMAQFNDAVAAFESALEVRTRERDAKLWALTRWHLALALFRQGLLQSDCALFDKSIAAYESALAEIKRRDMPVEWGLIQNELGTVHLTCAARGGQGGQDRKHLDEAVTAFRKALEAGNPDNRPLDWGAKQNNLGTALAALSERDMAPDRLDEAISAFKAALIAYQEASAPFYIVGVRRNLARVEAMLENRKDVAPPRQQR
jgi:tetratricopeptide (TPR) repeat protein